jgi:hypothetical protein
MKNKFYFLGILVAVILLSNCAKSPNHSIRVKNSYNEAMQDVKVNSTSYGSVGVGSTTDYKPVSEGSFALSGSTVSGKILSGSGTVSGKGTHKWTVTITSAGGVTIVEDK